MTASWGPPHVTRDHVLFQESTGYRVVRDLNFSDHVKRKKALKLYIILILKTSALRFFCDFFFWAKINKISSNRYPPTETYIFLQFNRPCPTHFWPFFSK